MFDALSISTNAAVNSLEMIDFLTENIINAESIGYNSKRFTFRDYLHGGTIESSGNSWKQGKKAIFVGEPTKMMLKGKGMFTVLNPVTKEVMYTRLGDFNFDKNGDLVTKDGFMALGVPLQSNLQRFSNLEKIQLGAKGDVGAFKDPFNNPAKQEYEEVAAGKPVGRPQPINLYVDPTNGLYLGKYDKIRVDKNGIIWGKYGDSEVSLYKISLSTFQNYNGLRNFRDTYWKQTSESGPALPCKAQVYNEALEKSNVWAKVEVDSMVEAQRQYSAAINSHKVADRLIQQAIELVG